MNQDWSKVATWLNGLIGGFIGAASGTFACSIAAPQVFDPSTLSGIKKLAIVALVTGIQGACTYLKNHPTPFDQTSVSASTTTQPGKAPVTQVTVTETHVEPKS